MKIFENFIKLRITKISDNETQTENGIHINDELFLEIVLNLRDVHKYQIGSANAIRYSIR
ncbi:Uncharacterised protein [Mycoplasma putrefaciens]|nr:Uncharacterised protein [Mycoplasma putrefaciens]